MEKITLYHGRGEVVEFPEVRKTKYTKDFSWGFYCTQSYEQAYRWAERRHEEGIINAYFYEENPTLKILKFERMTDEWLDFIADCRAVFWEYAKYKYPTHQMSFHTLRALNCLKFKGSEKING